MVDSIPPLDPLDTCDDCPICAWERRMLEEGKVQPVPGGVCIPPELEEELRTVMTTAGGVVVSSPGSALDEFTRVFEETLAAMLDPQAGLKWGRNEPCYCGSGRKFKRCHGRAA